MITFVDSLSSVAVDIVMVTHWTFEWKLCHLLSANLLANLKIFRLLHIKCNMDFYPCVAKLWGSLFCFSKFCIW